MAVVEVAGAHKSYGRRFKPPEKALDGLDLSVAEHRVHGFLARTGSAKTTTIRALLGLVRVDSGSLRLLDRPVPEQLP